ncbi:hypothetical protein LUZ60_006660 [Juncus effusus]|nr:hypothetical protein LUZ60_006660 [Juncus effusus]
MSQEQPRREEHQRRVCGPTSHSRSGGARGQGIKYGDVFAVGGDLADQVVSPRDAANMKKAESAIWGRPTPGGAGNTMASAAAMNVYYGAVRPDQESEVVRSLGITISETPILGGRMITEFVAGQVVSQYTIDDVVHGGRGKQVGFDQVNKDDTAKITIGEALEAAGHAIGNEPIQMSDVAAIREAEVRASGIEIPVAGGITDQANAAARTNMWATRDEDKIKLGDILSDATVKLYGDKPAEPEDAANVEDVEASKNPDGRPRPGGVAFAVANAAQINQGNNF